MSVPYLILPENNVAHNDKYGPLTLDLHYSFDTMSVFEDYLVSPSPSPENNKEGGTFHFSLPPQQRPVVDRRGSQPGEGVRGTATPQEANR